MLFKNILKTNVTDDFFEIKSDYFQHSAAMLADDLMRDVDQHGAGSKIMTISDLIETKGYNAIGVRVDNEYEANNESAGVSSDWEFSPPPPSDKLQRKQAAFDDRMRKAQEDLEERCKRWNAGRAAGSCYA